MGWGLGTCIGSTGNMHSCVGTHHINLLTVAKLTFAGGTGGDNDYKGIITSYDYDTAISEAGDYGQPGIGGPNKFEVSNITWPVLAEQSSAA